MRTDLITRLSNMGESFLQAGMASRANPKLVTRVARSFDRGMGIVKERAIDARVSYRTAQKLKQQGVL